jgi:hypothetical protein
MLIDNINSYISLLIEKIYSISKEIGIEYEYAKCLCQTDDISELETSIGILQGTVRSNDEKEVLLSYIVNKYNIRLDSLITPFFFNVLTPQPEGNFGDMFKSIYDPNNDGIVTLAAGVLGISGAGNSYYYGKNNSGAIGFFALPVTDLSTYATQSYVTSQIAALNINNYVLTSTLSNYSTTSYLTTNYPTRTQVTAEIAASSPVLSGSFGNTLITVGGITSGTNLSNKTFEQVMTSLFKPFIAATTTFSISSISLTGGTSSGLNIEYGATVTGMTFTYSVTLNGDTLSSFTVSGTNLTNFSETSPRTKTLSPSLTNNGTYTFTAICGSSTIIKSLTLNFIRNRYFKIVDTVPTDSEGVKALTKQTLFTVKDYNTGDISPSNQYIVYCYPSSLGSLTRAINTLGTNAIGSFTPTTVTVDGISYYVYSFYAITSPSAYNYQFS